MNSRIGSGRIGLKAGAPCVWPLKGSVLDTLAERPNGLLTWRFRDSLAEVFLCIWPLKGSVLDTLVEKSCGLFTWRVRNRLSKNVPHIWPLKGSVLDTLAERTEGLLILLRDFKLIMI